MTKNSKFWALSRVLRSDEGTPSSGVAERRLGISLGFAAAKLSEGLRHGEYTVHSMKKLCVLFVSFSVLSRTCLLD